jgi:DNA polymerase-3 subunit gamma/tau
VSLALARKYRPSTFNDLIGQESVSRTLSLALDNGRLSHAYLFSGLRGSGKTSTARIFAKALLCEKGESSHPCGECIHCIMAAENRHMDIIEMDAASNRGIDDIKDLIEHTKYKPSTARYKIFIIDEVHMLTNQAFNALLKTLEEPPDFVKFILATTDPLKLPATILSRTQHFRFKKIPQQMVQKHLEHILNLEEINFDKEAVEIIARSGAGSLRDSLTLLDQAIVYAQGHVDVATVTGMLGIIEPGLLAQLIESIMAKNTSAVLDFLRLAADYEAEMILDELTLYLKSVLLEGNTTLTPMIIERFFRIIAESKNLLSLGSDGEFVLSLALFKMIEALQIKDIDTMIRGLEKELKGVEINEIMVTTPAPDISAPKEVITITEEEIEATLPKESVTGSGLRAPEEKVGSKEQTDSSEQPEESGDTPSAVGTQKTAENDKQQIPSVEAAPPPTSPVETKEEIPSQDTQHTTHNAARFKTLVSKIYDRDYDLGACFERNITFVSFENDLLTWESTAQDDEKKILIKHWGVINMFVKELFGLETKIKNIAKKKAKTGSIGQASVNSEGPSAGSGTEIAKTVPRDTEPVGTVPVPHTDVDAGSMIEEVEMKSSCIAPEAGSTEAAKEKDPSTLLEEPMVKAALELLSPKKVRIKRKT